MNYKFDRYIDGRLMAEGVTIEKAQSLAEATLMASQIAPRGRNGQLPVLVLVNNSDDQRPFDFEKHELQQHQHKLINAYTKEQMLRKNLEIILRNIQTQIEEVLK